jgi:hypothetical protein
MSGWPSFVTMMFIVGGSVSFLDAVVNSRIYITALALAEIRGLFARKTVKARLATPTVRTVLALPARAGSRTDARFFGRTRKLRGAEAVYVALPGALDQTRITHRNLGALYLVA